MVFYPSVFVFSFFRPKECLYSCNSLVIGLFLDLFKVIPTRKYPRSYTLNVSIIRKIFPKRLSVNVVIVLVDLNCRLASHSTPWLYILKVPSRGKAKLFKLQPVVPIESFNEYFFSLNGHLYVNPKPQKWRFYKTPFPRSAFCTTLAFKLVSQFWYSFSYLWL